MKLWSAKLGKKVCVETLRDVYVCLRIFLFTELMVAKQKLKDESIRRQKDEAVSTLLHRWSNDILPNWETM